MATMVIAKKSVQFFFVRSIYVHTCNPFFMVFEFGKSVDEVVENFHILGRIIFESDIGTIGNDNCFVI